MKSNAQIICRSMRPDDVEAFFELCWDDSAKFTTESRELSPLDQDMLPADEDIKNYLKDYFSGKRTQPPVNITLEDVKDYTPLQTLDLLYRNGELTTYEAWFLNRMSALINSRRAFAIACLTGFRKVVDCFVEMHSREWFGPLISLIPYQTDYHLAGAPYLISAEGSAKKIGDAFFIHGGTNYWNRTWLPTTRWDSRWDVHVRNWRSLILRSAKMAKKLRTDNFQFLFVPEKDTLARAAYPGMFQSGLLPMVLIHKLMDVAPEGTVMFPVVELVDKLNSEACLHAGDSHLAANDYWTIFNLLLERFGLKTYADKTVGFDSIPNPGDLGSKFNYSDGRRQTIDLEMPGPEVAGGQTELQIPLRNNYVHFRNSKAPIQKSLLILGDSHSSTGANPFLTFIASHFFSHVEFFWNPFDVHSMPLDKLALPKYNYILFETSQRFATPAIE